MNGNVVTLEDVKKLGYSEGQATSQHLMMMLGNCEHSRRLGKAPLRVTSSSPRIEIKIIDPLSEHPLRGGYWLGPDLDIDGLVDKFVSRQIDDSIVRAKFLSGQLKVRAKCWQIGSDEAILLSNKPIRRIIAIRLNTGDAIAFENENGVPFVLTK